MGADAGSIAGDRDRAGVISACVSIGCVSNGRVATSSLDGSGKGGRSVDSGVEVDSRRGDSAGRVSTILFGDGAGAGGGEIKTAGSEVGACGSRSAAGGEGRGAIIGPDSSTGVGSGSGRSSKSRSAGGPTASLLGVCCAWAGAPVIRIARAARLAPRTSFIIETSLSPRKP
jgi:hypothetical protein